jgi:hypothetical protein
MMIGGGGGGGGNNNTATDDTLTQLLFLWKSVYVGIYCKAFGTACSHQ